MLIITLRVDAPAGQALGIKESLAMELEKYGDTRVVSVEERPDDRQLELEEREVLVTTGAFVVENGQALRGYLYK